MIERTFFMKKKLLICINLLTQLHAMESAQLELLQRAYKLERTFIPIDNNDYTGEEKEHYQKYIARASNAREKIYEAVQIPARLKFILEEKKNQNFFIFYLPVELKNELSRFIAGTSDHQKLILNNSNSYNEYRIKNSTYVLCAFKGIPVNEKFCNWFPNDKDKENILEPWVVILCNKKNDFLLPFSLLHNPENFSVAGIEFEIFNTQLCNPENFDQFFDTHAQVPIFFESLKAFLNKIRVRSLNNRWTTYFRNGRGTISMAWRALSYQNVSLEKIK